MLHQAWLCVIILKKLNAIRQTDAESKNTPIDSLQQGKHALWELLVIPILNIFLKQKNYLVIYKHSGPIASGRPLNFVHPCLYAVVLVVYAFGVVWCMNIDNSVTPVFSWLCLQFHTDTLYAPVSITANYWHGSLGARKSIQPVKVDWWGVGVVICLEQGADCLHMAQLMPLPSRNPIISCLS